MPEPAQTGHGLLDGGITGSLLGIAATSASSSVPNPTSELTPTRHHASRFTLPWRLTRGTPGETLARQGQVLARNADPVELPKH